MAGLIQRLELSSSYYCVNNVMRKHSFSKRNFEMIEIRLACISKTVCFSHTLLSFSLLFSLKYIHLDIHLYFVLRTAKEGVAEINRSFF